MTKRCMEPSEKEEEEHERTSMINGCIDMGLCQVQELEKELAQMESLFEANPAPLKC